MRFFSSFSVCWVVFLAAFWEQIESLALSSSRPPVLSGLIGLYTPQSFSVTDNVWVDLSDAGNNVTATGVVSVAVSSTGAPLFIWGTRSSSLMWPASVLPTDYTFFHVTRYLSGNKGGSFRDRIYQSAGSESSLSGFYKGKVGGAHRGSWLGVEPNAKTYGSDYGWNFVLSTDRRNSFRVNGRETCPDVCGSYSPFGRLAVNPPNKGETSDYAIRTILIYNGRLADSDVNAVEAWLYNRTCAAGSVFSLLEFGCVLCPRASLKTLSSTTCATSTIACPAGQKYSYSKSACQSILPPVTNGLFGAYTAESFDVSNGFWYDLSGAGNNVTDTCGISLAEPSNAPSFVFGSHLSSINWPVKIPVSFSLFYIARYNGPSRGRQEPLVLLLTSSCDIFCSTMPAPISFAFKLIYNSTCSQCCVTLNH